MRLSLKFIILFLSSFYLSLSYADQNSFQVIEINSSKTRAIIGNTNKVELQKADQLIWMNRFQQQCFLEVVKVNTSDFIADLTKKCEDWSGFSSGSKVNKGSSEITENKEEKEPQLKEQVQAEQTKKLSMRERSGGFPSKNESWYLYFAFGLSIPSYQGDLKDAVEAIEDAPGFDRSTYGGDLVGFYWPLEGHKTMIGGILNITLDQFSDTRDDDDYETVQINQYLLSFSSYHFFGENIGHQWYLRGDIGISYFSVTVDTDLISDSASSDAGIGALLGVGYALPTSPGARIFFETNVVQRYTDEAQSTVFNISIGMLL